jgi:hypothetical protein
MAGDWIKVEHTTPDKPEVFTLAELLQIDPDAVTGKLLRLWIWADQQTIDGNARSVTFALLDRIAGQRGFADALAKVGWLQVVDGGVVFSNFERHNGDTAKKRAQGSRRVAKHRTCNAESVTESQDCNAASVTKALPEKRREEIKDTHAGAAFGEQGQAFIPEKMNTPECLRAFAQWCDWCESQGFDAINPRFNGIQAEAVWSQANRIGPEAWPLCVEHSIANGYKSIVQRTEPAGGKRQKKLAEDIDPDFLRAVEVCKQFPGDSDFDREAREKHIGPELIRIVRKMGSRRFVECDRYTKKDLAAEWAINRSSMR